MQPTATVCAEMVRRGSRVRVPERVSRKACNGDCVLLEMARSGYFGGCETCTCWDWRALPGTRDAARHSLSVLETLDPDLSKSIAEFGSEQPGTHHGLGGRQQGFSRKKRRILSAMNSMSSSSAKCPVSRRWISALGRSRLYASAPAGPKISSPLPQVTSVGG